jgi:hypothetical protein
MHAVVGLDNGGPNPLLIDLLREHENLFPHYGATILANDSHTSFILQLFGVLYSGVAPPSFYGYAHND